MDSLLSIVQMPGGIPVGTLAIGNAGAKNAGLLAARIIGTYNEKVSNRLAEFSANQTQNVMKENEL
jgi:5-(carboxyamino)imidazole ribonucleotide mutase